MARLLTRGGTCALALAVLITFANMPARAAGDAAAGARLFRSHCSLCHTYRKGAGNRKGPNLFGVVGRPAGSVPTFAYSDAMRHSGIIWTKDELRKYLANPRGYIPGVRMTFPGFKNQKELEDVIAFLDTLK